MKIVFDEVSHKYFIDSIEVPSVSEILSFVNISDYSKIGTSILATAKKRGDVVHYATRLIDYGQKIEEYSMESEWNGYVDAYLKFIEEEKPEWMMIEHPIGSKKYMFGTTPDRIGIVRGFLSDVEIKTTASIMLSVRPQTAAHAICYNEDKKMVDKNKFI